MPSVASAPRPLPRLAGAVLVGSVALGGCFGAAADPWSAPGGEAGTLAVHETTARHIVQHYGPDPARKEPLGAVCLTAGRRHAVPVRQQERSAEWNPDGALLRDLSDLPHPVVPISECRWNDGLEEVHVPTGRPAAVVALSFPRWETPSTAWVEVITRESPRWRFTYRCHLVWRIDRWAVRSCV